MTNKEILSRISIEFDNGNICFNTEEGLIAVPVHEVLKQNYNDILLSLGRTFSEISLNASRADNGVDPTYSGVNSMRFINDLAASTIIMNLKNELESAKEQIKEQEDYIVKLEKELSWAQYK
jgi:hypothetical protein